MQFIKDGPDIPDALLQAHEDGKVVFFCGAGISYAAGLPDFQGLVKFAYEELASQLSENEKACFNQGQLDTTLDLLESRLPGGRCALRTTIFNILQPKLELPGAKVIHEAMLNLGRMRDGKLRLVTTNFDRIFELIRNEKCFSFASYKSYKAPLLPIPKKSHWDGLVYLHGLLPEEATEGTLDDIVLTSGDFGLAYLVDRWAARFVAELFRRYIVCFIGYSINDPIMRYLMDALAAERTLGTEIPQPYVFAGCSNDEKEKECELWRSKHVTPILYKIPKERDHSLLVNTLHVWSETYRDEGKKQIISKYASLNPGTNTPEDDFVGRVQWALKDPSGSPAEYFAKMIPAPSLDWLPLLESLFDEKGNGQVKGWLEEWLCHYLNNPELMLWIIGHPDKLEKNFPLRVQRKLRKICHDRKSTEIKEKQKLEEKRADTPESIPDGIMTVIWRLFYNHKIRLDRTNGNYDAYQWAEDCKLFGWDALQKTEFLDLLQPMVILKKPFTWKGYVIEKPEKIKDIFDCEVVPKAADRFSSLFQSRETKLSNAMEIDVCSELDGLLNEYMELWELLGWADETKDRSHWDRPSISDHRQNGKTYAQWAIIIQLLCDSWQHVLAVDSARANFFVTQWLTKKYPVYRRLCLFAATKDEIASHGEWVQWLLDRECFGLWSVATQREVMRLLVLRAKNLDASLLNQLTAAILEGPPESLFRKDIDRSQLEQIKDYAVWLRLKKMETAGCRLAPAAEKRLEELSGQYPKWQLADTERDEFSIWTSGTGDPDWKNEYELELERVPQDFQKLVGWLKENHAKNDDFPELCVKDPHLVAKALREAGKQGVWPAPYWSKAFYAWAQEKTETISVEEAFSLIGQMPEKETVLVSESLAQWLDSKIKSISSTQADAFLNLMEHLFDCYEKCGEDVYKTVDTSEASIPTMDSAINTIIGRLTGTLIGYWYSTKPSAGNGLPVALKKRFTDILSDDKKEMRNGYLILASNVVNLFRVDPEWSEKWLLPKFCWSGDREDAITCWNGFLWAPRIYMPLLAVLKDALTATASHLAELADAMDKRYVQCISAIALEPNSVLMHSDIQQILSNRVPSERRSQALSFSAEQLVQMLEGAGDQRESYFENRIVPFWREAWPKDNKLISASISTQLVLLTIAAGNSFPSAFNLFQYWLCPIEFPDWLLSCLHASEQCKKFPEEALGLIDAICKGSNMLMDLDSCLEQIIEGKKELSQDPRFIALEKQVFRGD